MHTNKRKNNMTNEELDILQKSKHFKLHHKHLTEQCDYAKHMERHRIIDLFRCVKHKRYRGIIDSKVCGPCHVFFQIRNKILRSVKEENG